MAKTPPPFAITLPATSANLGPAFDSAAIALRLHLRLRAAVAPEYSIAATGRDAETCGCVEPNLILATYREVLDAEGRTPAPLALTISNDMPIGRGTGSSAAARLAAISLAVHFGGLKWRDDRILAEAAGRERHHDNAAACWLGGVALVHPQGALRLRVRVRPKWPLLLAVPSETLLTERSRAVLPDCYPRADAVANVQHAMLLAAALVEGNPELLRHALRDRFHEPYRGPLCPLLGPLRELAAEKRGVLGAVLSGAGPSVLMVLDPAAPIEKTMHRIAARLAELGLPAELLLTEMESRGAAERRRIGRG